MDTESFLEMMRLDGVPVAAVDPADLLAVWKLQRGTLPPAGGGEMALGMDLYQRVCSPGADIHAVWYRATMLQLLAGPMQSLAPLDARRPTRPRGLSCNGRLPAQENGAWCPPSRTSLDVEEFLKELAKAASDPSAKP